MVFTRKIDDGLASLVKKLDAVVAENEEKKMFAFVNFVGEDAEALQKAAAEFGEKHEISNIALVVPKDHANGPKHYGIAAKTALVVALYSGKQVKALHALAEDQLSKKLIAAIVADTAKILVEEEEPKQDDQPDKEKKDRKKQAEKKEKKEA